MIAAFVYLSNVRLTCSVFELNNAVRIIDFKIYSEM